MNNMQSVRWKQFRTLRTVCELIAEAAIIWYSIVAYMR